MANGPQTSPSGEINSSPMIHLHPPRARPEEDDDIRETIRRADILAEKYFQPPLSLQREILPPERFPFEALGDILAPVAKRIHEVVKAPDAICGQSVLAAAALVSQAYADIHIDGRIHPLSLFMLTAAESGDRKSAIDNIALKPIRDYEKMLLKTCLERKRIYKNQLASWQKQHELLLRNCKPDLLEKELNLLPKEPRQPLEPNLLLEEPTYEGLVKLLAIGQPSIGLFSDEGGRMFGGYAMGKENLLKTACGLSSLWDGKPITRIRGHDDNLLLHGKRFSTHLMIQEVVLGDILKNDLLVGQGLIARCLIVAPPSNAGNRPYNAVDVSKDEIIQNFYRHISSMMAQSLPTNGDIENELFPRALPLSSAAKNRWIHFHNEIDRNLKPDGIHRIIRRTANKAPEQALRIAGVLTLIDHFEAAEISSDALERAVELVRYYLNEAIRITEMGAADPDLDLAQSVLEWMRKKTSVDEPEKTFSLQEIYQRAGPRGVRRKKTAEMIMGILEDHRLVERAPAPKLAWRLTPLLQN